MKRPLLLVIWKLFLAVTLLSGSCPELWGAPSEADLLVLRRDGVVAGILPQIGGRVMLFRTETGENVLDARPDQWKDRPSMDLLNADWKQRYGESIWAGPQGVWWTAEEPYPPNMPRKVNSPSDNWPPDPAWETAPFAIIERTPTRVVLRSPVSQLTGLELTKTVELLADGKLKIHASTLNRGNRIVARDLWFLERVPPSSRCFLPVKSETAEAGFTKAVLLQKTEGLTTLQLRTDLSPTRQVYGKMFAQMDGAWMAAAEPGAFFIVRFDQVDEAKLAPGQAPVEVYFSSAPDPLCEMEHHNEMKTLKPGEKMEGEETWQIVPDKGPADADAQARFLRTILFPGKKAPETMPDGNNTSLPSAPKEKLSQSKS